MRLLSLILSVFLFSQISFARDIIKTSVKQRKHNLSGSEYYSGSTPGSVLMKVKILGAVTKPGVHNVPLNTDLTSAISLAGGSTKEANENELTIKRKNGKSYKTFDVDFEEHLKTSAKDISLRPNDIVYIPQKKKFIDDNSFRNIFLLSTITAMIVNAIMIRDTL